MVDGHDWWDKWQQMISKHHRDRKETIEKWSKKDSTNWQYASVYGLPDGGGGGANVLNPENGVGTR
jgi:hypothetical protein